jgi:hypothetical protein
MARGGEGLGIHALAAGVIFVGGIGLASTSLGPMVAAASVGLAIAVEIGGDGLERLALVGLCIFVWRVFRPGSRPAVAGTAACAMGLFVSLIWEVRSQLWPVYDATLESAWSTQLSFSLPFAWSALETAMQWSRGRRQQAIGLMEPIAVERFALWSLACTGFVGICLLAVLAPRAAMAGHEPLASGLIGLRAALYYAVACLVWIGMFPPALYLRWRQSNAAR